MPLSRCQQLPIAILSLLASACAHVPVGESPIEQAQRRLPKESALVVAEACFYYRNLLDFNHYLKEESRTLAADGARSLIAAFKDYGVSLSQFAVPLMCASPLPPRSNDKDGRVAESLEKEESSPVTAFPIPYAEVVKNDAVLKAAYEKLFAECDWHSYKKSTLYECPLLSAEQAALLKSRLKTSYLVALSLGGDRASPMHKTGSVAFGLLLGFINVPSDEATARVRLINLDTGALVWSSFPAEFEGTSPADLYYRVGEGGEARYEDLKVRKGWEKKLLKPLFAKQR